jgi:hypothetical protein
VFSHSKLIADGPDGKLNVVEAPDHTIGGAMETTIGDSPVRCFGKPLILGDITHVPQRDFLRGIQPETYLTVKPGQTIFLRYIVSDLNGGQLRTAQLAIEIDGNHSRTLANPAPEGATQSASPHIQPEIWDKLMEKQQARKDPNLPQTKSERSETAEAVDSSRAMYPHGQRAL